MTNSTEAVPDGALTPDDVDAQASALTEGGDAPETQQVKDEATEALNHKKQQRRHKEILFACALMLCVVLLGYFTAALYHFDALLAVTKETHFAIFPVMLSGVIPTTILIFMLKSVFNVNNLDAIDKKDLEIFKEIAGIVKSISK